MEERDKNFWKLWNLNFGELRYYEYWMKYFFSVFIYLFFDFFNIEIFVILNWN